ncbi:lipopolysaccharide-induced tumor necrosis factor-alpha factor homolog [Salarias fasciatus]|uniref:lipopolysaccharide-induced tumor necrosis factor-alpha factor homolog n=1 Tax=Salarias fasciatus TaxID=181472 RepID=UPI001176A314|nr:lipopolysaccharide-induced tumor necrosis factor-alpha factor homolog [Salarias fasciatus]XP_029945333.1 lipopolysaccharide-induced tumor necrosis factor-alpha factor homolog [Salarias fasciatus]
MDKGYLPQESAPPYPGPPMNYGGPMPQPGVYPQQGAFPGAPTPVYQGVSYAPPPTVPVTTVTHVMVAPALRESPARVVCQHCQQSVVTSVVHTPGLLAWLICGGLALVGLCLCSCIPFCVDSCQDIEHRCPSCHGLISVYKRM